MSSSRPAFKSRTLSSSQLKIISKKESGGSPQGSVWIIVILLSIVTFIGYHIYDSGKEVAPGIIETSIAGMVGG